MPITCKFVSSWDSNNGIATGMGCVTVEASTTGIETLSSRGYKWIRGCLTILSFYFKITGEPWRYKGLVATPLPSWIANGFATCFELVVTAFIFNALYKGLCCIVCWMWITSLDPSSSSSTWYWICFSFFQSFSLGYYLF